MGFWDTAFPYVVEIMAYLIITVIGVLGAFLVSKINTGKKLSNIAGAVSLVTSAAQTTVSELKQTLVDTWKEQAENNKLTEKQVTDLKEKLLAMTKGKLGQPIIALLEAAQVDINALIQSAGEAYLEKIKRTSGMLEIAEAE